MAYVRALRLRWQRSAAVAWMIIASGVPSGASCGGIWNDLTTSSMIVMSMLHARQSRLSG